MLRREPFRLLFPLGVVAGWLGVLPWLLFGSGLIREWMGVYHALTMTQGFLMAVAAGFLGTMLPRRTGSAPASWWELGVFALGPLAIPLALVGGRLAVAESLFIVELVTLAQFGARRLARSARSMPPSFVLLPAGALTAAVGAGLLLSSAFGAGAWTLPAGRSMAEEGLFFGMVLALAPMLSPIIEHGSPVPDGARRWPWLLAALALIASFAVQHGLHERAGLFLRGATAAAVLLFGADLWRPSTAPGLHRRLYRLALVLVPLGPLAAAARPALRVPLLHLSFIGGLSLLIFAVSLHVTFMHTGREPLASRRPWPVALVAALTIAALAVRVTAEQVPSHYFGALALAAALWLMAATAWLVFVTPMMRRSA